MKNIFNKKIILGICLLLLFPLFVHNLLIVKADESDWEYSNDFNRYSGYTDSPSYLEPNGTTSNVENPNANVLSAPLQWLSTHSVIGVTMCIVGGAFLFTIVIRTLFKQNATFTTKLENDQKEEVSEQELQKVDPSLNLSEIKEKTFSLYKKTEIARVKSNIKSLKELVTDDLYSSYEQELKKLKTNHQKVVATDITLKDAKILSVIKEENQPINIVVYLHVSQYDYIIDKNKKVVRGTDQDHYQIEYKITLIKEQDQLKIKKKECTGKWISK